MNKTVCPQPIVCMCKYFCIQQIDLVISSYFVLYLPKTATICHSVSLLLFGILFSQCLCCSFFVKCVHVHLIRNTCMNTCVCVCARTCHCVRTRDACVCQQHQHFFFNETRLQSVSGHRIISMNFAISYKSIYVGLPSIYISHPDFHHCCSALNVL